MQSILFRRAIGLTTVFVAGSICGMVTLIAGKTAAFRATEELSATDHFVFSSLFLPSAIIAAVAFWVMCVPLFGVRHLVRGVRPTWLFPAAAVGVGLLVSVMPTALAVAKGTESWRELVSPYSFPIYSMDIVVGTIAGLGFTLLYRANASNQAMQRTAGRSAF